MTLSDRLLARIRELQEQERAATPGPWECDRGKYREDGEDFPLITPKNGENPVAMITPDYWCAKENAQVLVAARNAWPSVLQMARRDIEAYHLCGCGDPDCSGVLARWAAILMGPGE